MEDVMQWSERVDVASSRVPAVEGTPELRRQRNMLSSLPPDFHLLNLTF